MSKRVTTWTAQKAKVERAVEAKEIIMRHAARTTEKAADRIGRWLPCVVCGQMNRRHPEHRRHMRKAG